jgi:D-alanyl-D-alanine carboxypeptidase
MKTNISKNLFTNIISDKKQMAFIILIVILTGVCAYFYKINSDFKKQNILMETEAKNLKISLDEINQKYIDIINKIEVTEKDKIQLFNSLNGVLSDYNGLMQNYDTKIKEVDILNKAVFLDDELLKKYSKFYFLNENYAPSSTELISPIYTLSNKDIRILTEVKPKLENMILAAKNYNQSVSGTSSINNINEINLVVHSGYRSFAEQKGLKSAYTKTYGISKSNQFSADQGYSEHQLGTTVDITDGRSGLVTSFDKTKTFEWLQNNAHKYGFILSYNKNNTYYQYEPWHWRYVGVELATYMKTNNLNFYDIDQNKIDEYKTKIFD